IEAGEIGVGSPIPVGIVEPQFVAQQRAAPRRVDVPDLLQPSGGGETLGPQGVAQVRCLQVLVRVCQDEVGGKLVAALFRNQVGGRSEERRVGKECRCCRAT